ncbi:FLOT1 protein, partial [Paradoxornis webbianus]|nr:FLOT1 protein [Sinosuthora webbiana]
QEIYKDRQKFSDQVFRVASSDLVNMGISVVSYTLKDVHDEQTWDTTETHSGHTWDTLGDAEGQDGETWDTPGRPGDSWGHLGTPGAPSTSHPQYSPVPSSALPAAPSAPSTPHTPDPVPAALTAARSQQAIAAQRGEVALVERAQRAQLQEQEVGRRRQELEATVRKPAEAERYRLERLAEAQR